MKKEFAVKLREKYPTLFGSRGVECLEGWYYLLDTIGELLAVHAPEAVTGQVKEKFGGLRFYYHGGGDFADGVTSMAEYLSESVCEMCGAPGATYHAGWVATRCDQHATARNLGGSKFELSIEHTHGLGLGWSRLAIILQAMLDFYIEKNGMPVSTLAFAKRNGQFVATLHGGDERAAGMVAFINHYAQRIDEYTGEPHGNL